MKWLLDRWRLSKVIKRGEETALYSQITNMHAATLLCEGKLTQNHSMPWSSMPSQHCVRSVALASAQAARREASYVTSHLWLYMPTSVGDVVH